MSSAPSNLPDDEGLDPVDPIEATATEWLARRDRGFTATEAADFAHWCAADPRHETAVLDLGAMWGALDDLSALRGTAASVSGPPAPSARVVSFEAEGRAVRRRRLVPVWALAVAACFALVAGAVVWQRASSGGVSATHYETAVGDRRTITLSDGSTLQLNTRSAVDVRFTEGERRVELTSGEVFFAVAKDAGRPFVVRSGGVLAHALGTAFVVRRGEKETEMVVTEGRVKFGARDVPSSAVVVTAGQRATCDPQNPSGPRVEALDTLALTRRFAWQTGRLMFRPNMPLGEVAAEFNRYHQVQLVPQDEATAAVPVDGAFEFAKLDAFVRFLETSFDVIVVSRDAERIVLKSKR